MPRHAISPRDIKDLGNYQEDSLSQYLDETKRFPLLTAEQEQSLARARDNGDTSARQRLVEHNLRLVVAIARGYSRRTGIALLDLVQEGNIGLMKAAEKFDGDKINPATGRPYRFTTFATARIVQAMGRCLHEQRLVYLPSYYFDAIKRLKKHRAALEATLGYEPSLKELAAFVDLPEAEVQEMLLYGEDTASLDAGLVSAFNVDENATLGDMLMDESIAQPGQDDDQHVLQEQLERALSVLSTRERDIIRMRFGLSRDDDDEPGDSSTLLECGKHFKVSRERVRQIEKDALNKLRQPLQRELAREAMV